VVIVINPYDVAAKYGTDALRYYLLKEITPFEDGDFTYENFEESYSGKSRAWTRKFGGEEFSMAEKITLNAKR